MNRFVLPLVFLTLGTYLIWSAGSFPGGAGATPGAGSFPMVIGAMMALLATLLVFRGGAPRTTVGGSRMVWGAIALLFGYLALWGTGWFALRTVVFLVLLLRLAGEKWTRSVGVAGVLTAIVVVAFQFGLNVSWG